MEHDAKILCVGRTAANEMEYVIVCSESVEKRTLPPEFAVVFLEPNRGVVNIRLKRRNLLLRFIERGCEMIKIYIFIQCVFFLFIQR